MDYFRFYGGWREDEEWLWFEKSDYDEKEDSAGYKKASLLLTVLLLVVSVWLLLTRSARGDLYAQANRCAQLLQVPRAGQLAFVQLRVPCAREGHSARDYSAGNHHFPALARQSGEQTQRDRGGRKQVHFSQGVCSVDLLAVD